MKTAAVRFAACSILLSSSVPAAAAAGPANIGSSLQPYVDRHELAGAVTLVASKDNILSLEAIGYSDIAARKPMQTDALFWIASMSKPIAATALMILVREGTVRLDDSVEKYLPQFTPRIMVMTADATHVLLQKPQHAMAVRNLLSHTSGIPYRSSLETPTLDLLPLAIRVQSYALEPLLFEPGGDASYSNAGINTAARIIEVVSGMRYEEFLQRRLFDPLGMKETTFWPTESQLKRLAKSYKPNASKTGLEQIPITQLSYPLTDRTRRYAVPAGGLFSTARDLARFCQMLLNGGTFAGRRYLSEAAIQEMTHNQLSPADQRGTLLGEGGYGLGWETSPSGVFGHGGAYSTHMGIDPVHGLATVWLVQHAGFPGDGARARDSFEEAAIRRFTSVAVHHKCVSDPSIYKKSPGSPASC